MKPVETTEIPSLLVPPGLAPTIDSLERNILEQEKQLSETREALARKNLELSQATEAGPGKPAQAAPEEAIDEFREPFAKCMAEVSVAIWRIGQSAGRMEESKETRRIQRDLANCVEALKALGISIVDRANADLNTGMYRDIEIVTNEVSPEATSVTVSEVLKPAVHFSVRHPLLRKSRERADQPPFIIQKCQVVTKSPPPSET